MFHAGSTSTVGDVDKGNTVTDYLIQERDRGITITSAAVTYNWKKHRINLIDTPGHVDFTIEVERSLSVLDGAVTILDASAGVEAQTVTVWNQASKFKLPNVIFLNKSDKPQANYTMCLKDLKSSLGVRAGLVHLPVKLKSDSKGFSSIIDVINRKLITWSNPERDNGAKFCVESLRASSSELVPGKQQYLAQLEEARELLVNHLTDCSDDFASHVIECERMADVSGQELGKALRMATLDCNFSPVLVGSSFKYIGVQQLMDAILHYLPSPIERERQLLRQMFGKERALGPPTSPCAFVFKIMHDKRLGALNYARICSGQIKRGQWLSSLDSGRSEQIKRVYRAFADELREIESPVCKDDIVILTGLAESRTGDILLRPEERIRGLIGAPEGASEGEEAKNCGHTKEEEEEKKEEQKQPFQLLDGRIVVPRISKLDPVYYCTIEAANMAQQVKLESALACLSREDPSFTYEIDSLGVGTVRGMGKLHLEISKERMRTEHGVDSLLGPMQISYRETIDQLAVEELELNRIINSVKSRLTIRLQVRPRAGAGLWRPKQLRLEAGGELGDLHRLRRDHRRAIELGLAGAARHGPLLGYPLIDCDILLLDFQCNQRCSLPLISSAASQCLGQALARGSPKLMEPIMQLEVVAPKQFNGSIAGDLTGTRRALVLGTTARAAGDSIVLRAQAPLATLADYAEYLRITTSGRASFSMELHNYVAMSEAERRNIVRI